MGFREKYLRTLPKYLKTIFLVEILLLSFFFFSIKKEDHAMDKTGIGDYQQFKYWDDLAGKTYHFLLFIWIAGCIFTIIDYLKHWKEQDGRYMILHAAVIPFFFVSGYVISLFTP